MKIAIISRVKFPGLYERMVKSAKDTATVTEPVFMHEVDDGEGPRIARTYNRLAAKSDADILVFAHEDSLFISPGWDASLVEAFYPGDYGVLGVIGTKHWEGWTLFASGIGGCGKYISMPQGNQLVRVASPLVGLVEPCKAVDGLFMAVPRPKFNSFDENICGLYFYDIDYCLRNKCGIVDILIAHNRPPGPYLEDDSKRPPVESEDYFYKKHGIPGRPEPKPEEVCALIPIDEYLKFGQDECYRAWKEKFFK